MRGRGIMREEGDGEETGRVGNGTGKEGRNGKGVRMWRVFRK